MRERENIYLIQIKISFPNTASSRVCPHMDHVIHNGRLRLQRNKDQLSEHLRRLRVGRTDCECGAEVIDVTRISQLGNPPA